ncbi:hypothetical protein L596_030284 [Steinernema carpocapsae]|uniref:Uncharacterized protein n=1 Tax=Steinernema carpocapsae TaxID=34508 RepID=A0A4U5LNY2_STECR|nr:hypothetical protein L596_030284 [Steinernema carpocapsae]
MKTALNQLGNDLVEEADENRELLQALKTQLDQLEKTAARCIVDRLRAKRGVSQATSPARSTSSAVPESVCVPGDSSVTTSISSTRSEASSDVSEGASSCTSGSCASRSSSTWDSTSASGYSD